MPQYSLEWVALKLYEGLLDHWLVFAMPAGDGHTRAIRT